MSLATTRRTGRSRSRPSPRRGSASGTRAVARAETCRPSAANVGPSARVSRARSTSGIVALGVERAGRVDASARARPQARLREGQLGAEGAGRAPRRSSCPRPSDDVADRDVVEDRPRGPGDVPVELITASIVARPVPCRPARRRHDREAGQRRRAERGLRAATAGPGPAGGAARGDAESVDGQLGHVDARVVQGEDGAQLPERSRSDLGERGGEGAGGRATPEVCPPRARPAPDRRAPEAAEGRSGERSSRRIAGARTSALISVWPASASAVSGPARGHIGARVGREPARPEPRLALRDVQTRPGQSQRQVESLTVAPRAESADACSEPVASRASPRPRASAVSVARPPTPETPSAGASRASSASTRPGERDGAVAAGRGPRRRPRARATARRAGSARRLAPSRRTSARACPRPIPPRAPGSRALSSASVSPRLSGTDQRAGRAQTTGRAVEPEALHADSRSLPAQHDRPLARPRLAEETQARRASDGATPRPFARLGERDRRLAATDTRPSTWSAAPEPSSRSRGWSARSSSSSVLLERAGRSRAGRQP